MNFLAALLNVQIFTPPRPLRVALIFSLPPRVVARGGEGIGGLWPPFFTARTPMRSIGMGGGSSSRFNLNAEVPPPLTPPHRCAGGGERAAHPSRGASQRPGHTVIRSSPRKRGFKRMILDSRLRGNERSKSRHRRTRRSASARSGQQCQTAAAITLSYAACAFLSPLAGRGSG